MYGYIYKTINLINGKIYIGQHKSSVFDKEYKGSGKLIRRAFDKYGFDNFYCELLEWCETRADINKAEKVYIKKYKSNQLDIGYNISKGGDGGDTFSGLTDVEKEHRREKMKMSMSGRIVINNGEIEKYVNQDELQKYLDNGFVAGYLHTPERDKTRSEAKKKFHREHPDFRNDGMFKKGSSGFTGHHTEETKEKIRQKLVGTKQSEETRKLKSQLLKERYASGWQNPMKGKEPHNKGEKGVWMWVTNGINNIRLKTTDDIPEGYYRGRIVKTTSM